MVIYYYNFVEIIKLFILSGRVNGDEEGVFTCNKSSVVYYYIHCHYCVQLYMSVLDFSQLCSDVRPLELDDVISKTSTYINMKGGKGFKKWDSEKESSA